MGNSMIPEMPQFRQPGGGTDWRQVADMFIPGNVWNSRTDEWRPRGMVAGAASTAFGPLGGALVEATEGLRMPRMPNFSNPFSGMGNWLSGRTGREDPYRPSQYGPRRSDNLPRVGTIPRWNDEGASRPETGPYRVEDTPAAPRTRAERGESPIGLGQLGRGGDEAMLYYSQAMRGRNGALMER